MGTIIIHAGEISATCEEVESAAALIRALMTGLPAPSEKVQRKPKREALLEPIRRTPEVESTNGHGRRGKIKDQLFALLEKDPETDLGTLAKKIYGTEERAARNRVGTALATFVKRGSLEKLRTGGYRVV